MTKFCTNRNKQTILIESIPYSNWEIEMVRMNTVSYTHLTLPTSDLV